MAPWPRGATCTTAPRGQGAMPLAVRSSEGLGSGVWHMGNLGFFGEFARARRGREVLRASACGSGLAGTSFRRLRQRRAREERRGDCSPCADGAWRDSPASPSARNSQLLRTRADDATRARIRFWHERLRLQRFRQSGFHGRRATGSARADLSAPVLLAQLPSSGVCALPNV